jgi:flagellar biosynthesis protein FlhB
VADDRTERPTPRRLRDARRKGQVARSRDLVHSGALAAALMAMAFSGAGLVEGLGRALRATLAGLHRFPSRDLRIEEMTPLALSGLGTLTILVGPVALTALVATIALFGVQGGWVFANEALQPNFGRLNPVNGMKKLGFSAGGIDTIKMVLLVAVLGFLGYRVVSTTLEQSARFARLSPLDAGRSGWEDAARLLRQCAIAMLVFGGADYAVQRWRLTKSLRMTKQEVKDDLKLAEGNPEIKARIRRIQLTQARQRMLSAVPKATVVITNPTHYAVALEYDRAVLAAPRVVAKGRGHLAQKIKAIAREHGVPMVENVPLAQALYKGSDVGDFIPAALFEAVAEVLAYLIRLKQLVL